jgi:hypothetical protein
LEYEIGGYVPHWIIPIYLEERWVVAMRDEPIITIVVMSHWKPIDVDRGTSGRGNRPSEQVINSIVSVPAFE